MSNDDQRSIYERMLSAWNRRDAHGFAADFAEDGEVIGFDGSEIKGHGAIESGMRRIFADHETGEYVGIIREVVPLTSDVMLVRAVAGLVPAGQPDLNPALNSTQRMLLKRTAGKWRIVTYQNTPAQFHGRPAEVERLTAELREARARGRTAT